jgi:hypothetical protein
MWRLLTGAVLLKPMQDFDPGSEVLNEEPA